MALPRHVLPGRCTMDRAVQLDNELCVGTVEDETVHGVLPPEPQPEHLPLPQAFPQMGFRCGGLTAHYLARVMLGMLRTGQPWNAALAACNRGAARR